MKSEMTPDENILIQLKSYIGTLIGEYREVASSAIREMEKFNISTEDFRKESLNLNVAAFILGYLNRINEVSGTADYMTTGNFIRYHLHQLESMASGEDQAINTAQSAVISILSSITALFLDR